MKCYSINVHYDVCVPVDVLAETEEEALNKAQDQAERTPLSEALTYCHINYTDACVTDIQTICKSI